MVNNPKRPHALGNEGVGQKRYKLYGRAIEAYKDAIRRDYVLEALILTESLLEDQLESLANKISSTKDYSLNTLGCLIDFLKKQNLPNYTDLLKDINEWRKRRNDAVHQMAKILDPDFSKHYSNVRPVAREGFELFRKIDRLNKVYFKTLLYSNSKSSGNQTTANKK